ncbi:major facilitator superfamily transporter [Trichoderma longibrachiatum]|uniref:MFS general substrate transporter n=1 Tax=Trichoderma longibrachiatum ATCC 18648 TaxID=983965 RepID=A0A2T4CGV1_TRILO|nr:MFS general substrate transporter [Trichoderma longibrachiatum ATCC 18648]
MAVSSTHPDGTSSAEPHDASQPTTTERAVEALEVDDFQGPGAYVNILPVWRFWVLCFGVCAGLLLSIIDSSILATSLYTIGVEFQEHSLINWVVLAYTLGYTGFAVSCSTLSDIIGQRNAFAGSYIIFVSFSIACGFARQIKHLIICRAFQGVGGSGLYALSMIILTQQCPPQLRQYIGSIIGVVIASAGILGPVLGGFFTEYTSWRWIFWVNGPIGVISLLVFLLSWPSKREMPRTQTRPWRQFDFVGTVLGIAASVLVVFAFQNAGESGPGIWGRAVFIAPVVTGLACWVGVVAWGYAIEKWFAHCIVPVFPIQLFRIQRYARSALTTFLVGYPHLLLIFSFPIRMQIVSGKSPLIAGLMLLPMLGTVAIGSMVSGKINSTKDYLSGTLRCGTWMMALGFVLLPTIKGSEDDAKALGFLAFAGFGFGLFTAAATNVISVDVPTRQKASAHGITAQARILGGSLGISISTLFLHTEVINRLPELVPPEELASIRGDMQHLKGASLEAVKRAYVSAFHKGITTAAVAACLAVLSTAFITCQMRRRERQRDVEQQREDVAPEEREPRVAEPLIPLQTVAGGGPAEGGVAEGVSTK